MKRFCSTACVLLLGGEVLISAASLPSSKAAAQVTTVTTCGAFASNPCTNTDNAVAEGTVRVRALLDPSSLQCQTNCTSYRTLPDLNAGVVFDQRIQTLSANLGFIFTGQCALDPTTCTLTPEQITLVLDTTAAHAFNFILPNVGAGTHTLVIQAQLSTENTSVMSTTNGGVSVSNALFGLGSLTIDAVRLVNSFNCTTDSSGAMTCSS